MTVGGRSLEAAASVVEFVVTWSDSPGFRDLRQARRHSLYQFFVRVAWRKHLFE